MWICLLNTKHYVYSRCKCCPVYSSWMLVSQHFYLQTLCIVIYWSTVIGCGSNPNGCWYWCSADMIIWCAGVFVAWFASNAQKSTSEHTDLPPIISGDFSTRSTAVCVHVVDKNPFRWRTTPMHRYTQQIFMYSPQQMYWYIEHTVFLKI